MTHPHGTWPSPITASVIASQSVSLSSVTVDGPDIYWLEVRPQEAGRTALVRLGADGELGDVNSSDSNVRTRVHEYGGGAYCVHARVAYYVNFKDQRIYRRRGRANAVAITPEQNVRYADLTFDQSRNRLVCVREDHRGGGEAVNTLVAVTADQNTPSEGHILASGHDFYSSPRVSHDGRFVAWLAWRHPNMPWDGTELWIAAVNAEGELDGARPVAGGHAESILQPGWSADSTLYFVSDRDGWWRFYRLRPSELAAPGAAGTPKAEAVLSAPIADTEFGRPQWVLGTHLWSFLNPSTIVTTFMRSGHAGLALIDVDAGLYSDVPTSLEPLDDIAVIGTDVIFVAGSTDRLPSLVRVSITTQTVQTLKTSSSTEIARRYLSQAEAIEFPTANGLTAHAFYYPPTNPDCTPPSGDKPPLVVIIHGGPTDAAKPTLRLSTQYWTSRGFAIVDVDHGGSSGFGRAYRQRLNEQWGVVDVADCVNAAKYLVAQGKADPDRLIIRGGSAGGFTTLAALAFQPGVFKAGASYYGIGDLEVLAGDTHKFESRYMDHLIGPYPARRDVYRARSPIHSADRISSPVIFLHGAEDKMVPPNQTQMMAESIRAKGVAVAVIIFEGEQHGFRQATTMIRALEAELWFYGAVFGFKPADRIEPVEVANLAT